MKRILLALIGGVTLLAIAAGAWFYQQQRREPDRLAGALDLETGMTVAEIGAGSGSLTIRVARRLGAAGRIYSSEVEQQKRAAIEAAAEKAGLANVTVIEAREKSTNLPRECCDAIYMRHVYHHFKAPEDFAASLYASLKPGGRVAVIDFEPGGLMFWLPKAGGVPENRRGHGVPTAVVVKELAGAGFVIEQRIKDWSPVDFCIVAKKP